MAGVVKRGRRFLLFAVLCFVTLGVGLRSYDLQAKAPDAGLADPSAGTISGTPPVMVDLPSGQASPETLRPWFDEFSWRTFIALNWPVDPTRPGVPLSPGDPRTFLDAKPGYTTVWDSYRDASDLFRTDTAAPPLFDDAAQTPTICGTPSPGNKVLLMQSESGTVLGDVEQAFSYPLVDQHKNYVYYEIRYNRDQYEFVRGNQLYLAKKLQEAEEKAPIAMPISAVQPYREGALMIKAAWKQLTADDDARRYYTTQAMVVDQSTGKPVCKSATLGLIGLHVGRKITGFPQWIWSTFEQVDNVPPDHGAPTRAMSLNNGQAEPQTSGGWANRPAVKRQQPLDTRVSAQVTRLNPIPTTPQRSTVYLNAVFRGALSGTVWSNYQLIVTQWPSEPVDQSAFTPKENGGLYPKDAGTPFPLHDAVNTAIESFFQSQSDAAGAGGNSCMECHYGAGKADFSWSLKLRAK